MFIDKNSLTIFSQLNSNSKSENHSHQLSLPLSLARKPLKPQISSIPGISPLDRHRYRVKLRDEILGEFLTAEEARELANSKVGGAK